MKTSYYFSNRIRDPDLPLVGVSNSYPRRLPWLKGIRTYKPLCPGWSLLKDYKQERISRDQYIQIYREDILDKLNPEKVFHDLGQEAVILCWERPGAFCHRRLIADWLNDHLNIKVKEL